MANCEYKIASYDLKPRGKVTDGFCHTHGQLINQPGEENLIMCNQRRPTLFLPGRKKNCIERAKRVLGTHLLSGYKTEVLLNSEIKERAHF